MNSEGASKALKPSVAISILTSFEQADFEEALYQDFCTQIGCDDKHFQAIIRTITRTSIGSTRSIPLFINHHPNVSVAAATEKQQSLPNDPACSVLYYAAPRGTEGFNGWRNNCPLSLISFLNANSSLTQS